jgi:hypothetical protein
MPYPYNSPRWEFSATDRATMLTQANVCVGALDTIINNTTIDTHYVIQITDVGRVPRGNFDAVAAALNGLTPTYNPGTTLPLSDTR